MNNYVLKQNSTEAYWIKPVAMPNPFTVKRNNQRSFRDPGLSVTSKQWEPTSIIPEI